MYSAEKQIKDFFDLAGEEYEDSRYSFMRRLRAKSVKNELITGFVLDVGCNCGRLLKEYISDQSFVGIDLSHLCLQNAAKHCPGHYVNASASALPFKNSTFDCVVSSETLYYLNDELSFLNKVINIIKPGGKLVIVSSNQLYYNLGKRLGVILKLIPKDINQKTYKMRDLIKFLNDAGFINIKGRGAGVIPFKGFEFLDRTMLKRFGFIFVVTGTRPL